MLDIVHLERSALRPNKKDRPKAVSIASVVGSTQSPVSFRSKRERLARDDFSSNRHPALSFCLSMIFSENRYPLFRIML